MTIELVKRFGRILRSLRSGDSHHADQQTEETLFDEMVQLALWGNATDLTLHSSLSVDETLSRQGKKARDASSEYKFIRNMSTFIFSEKRQMSLHWHHSYRSLQLRD